MTEIIEINTGRQVVTRAEAREKGLKFFFTGVACKWGHVSERYTSSKACVACTTSNVRREYRKRYYETNREEVQATNALWQAANPDRAAAKGGWRYAKRCGAIFPPEFKTVTDLILATIGHYQTARELTATTGILHVVDHVLPLARGGEHTPINLRIVTQKFNRAKASKTDAECLTAILDGTWRGPMDAETVLMLVNSVRYDIIVHGTTLRIAA